MRRLLAWFGEELGRESGHCGPCAGAARVELVRAERAVSWPAEELAALRAQYPRELGGARQVARFLCGIASPALSAAKLTRHPRFGCAAEAPFAAVMQAAKAAMSAERPGP